jgi:hypothetical protein
MIGIMRGNTFFVVVFPYIFLIAGVNTKFTVIVHIIAHQYGADFITVNAVTNILVHHCYSILNMLLGCTGIFG